MRKRRVRAAAVLLSILLAFPVFAAPALAGADIPYDSYIYNYRDYVEFTPAPYIPGGSVSGVTLGIGSFKSPQDLCVAPNGLIYVADTDNDRIVLMNPDMTETVVIDSFINGGKTDSFNKPCGVTVSEKNLLYIADTNNNRIVVLNAAEADGPHIAPAVFEVVKVIDNPQSEMLPDNYLFSPLKLGVDYADRVYVIARNVFQGIMVFSSEGDFLSYFGTITVTVSLWERIWRRLSTQAQRSKGMLFIPTTFTGIDVDQEGFVYASFISTGDQAAFRLNPRGDDVIKTGENGNLAGDIDYRPRQAGQYDGPSYIVDIIIREKGIFSILDSKRGRIFTYDDEGNLLYIFGGLGAQAGTFKVPCAMAHFGDKMLVLDTERQEILLFTETEYGRLINEAVGLRYDGNEKLAVDLWQQVLTLNENLELANIGIGKAYLSEGNNKEAMKHLKLGMDRTYYSIAFKRYRNDILKDNLGYILTVVIVAALALYIRNTVKNKGVRKGNLLTDD